MAQHIFTGTTAPSITPTKVGQHYVDTVAGTSYISIGTSSSADWKVSSVDLSGYVPSSRTVNGHALTTDVIVTKTDIGLSNVPNTDATVASNITQDSTHRFTNDTDITRLTNTSGTNTGDETISTIKTKLGITTLSGSNTGDQDLSGLALKTTTVNGHALSSNVTVTASDVGLGNVNNTSDINKPISTAQQTALNAKVDGNSAITGATNTKITYDAKGLVTSGTSISLNDLTDVLTTAPSLNEILVYNGLKFVNSPLVLPTSGGNGVNYFLTANIDSVSGYDFMSKTPDSASEVDESITITNQTSVFESYISDTPIGSTSIDAGLWTFNIYSYVSTVSGSTNLSVSVYKRTAGGTETFLFSQSGPSITDTSVALQSGSFVQPAYSINPTDVLVFKFSATTTSLVPVTVHLVHSGNTHYSNINTPLITRHNDLAGLQGGTSGEEYHLTSAEYTGTGSGNFVRASSPNITTPTGIVKADIGLGNVVNLDTSTTANITDSSNKRFVTDAELTVLSNTSGTNTGDNAVNTLYSGLATSKENTITATTSADYYRGDKTFQPLNKAAVGLGSVVNSDTTTTANITDSVNKRFVTDADLTTIGNQSGTNTGDQIISDATITTTDITTNNFSTAKHGFVPKGTNVGNFLKDDGTWATPAGVGGGVTWIVNTVAASTLTLTAASNEGQIFTGTTGGQIVQLPDATTLAIGKTYSFINKSDPLIRINDGAGAFETILLPTKQAEVTLIDNTSAGGVWFIASDYLDYGQVKLFDDFVTASTATLTLGALGWTLTTGTVAQQTVTGNSFGVVRLSSSTANNGLGALSLGTTAPVLLNNSPTFIETRVSFPSIGGTAANQFSFHTGLLNATTVVTPGTNPLNAIGFSYHGTAVTAGNIFGFSSSATLTTTIDSGIQVVAGTWYKLSMVVNATGTQAYYYINNNYVGMSVTNMPTAIVMAPQMKVSAGSTNAAAKTTDIDFYEISKLFVNSR